MKRSLSTVYVLAVIVTMLALTGCGGGGSEDPGGGGSKAPVANAGPNQNVSTGSLVTLDGSGSTDANGDLLTYHWSFTSRPGGSSAALSNSTLVNPTFTADVDGSYELSLTVNDGTADSTADTVTITASSGNSAPIANAGADQNVATGSVVTLNGSGSSDANGDPLTYSWSFTSKPASSAAVFSATTTVSPTFTADKDGTYVIQLIVNDGVVDSMADTVTITAATANSVPVANAGPDQNVYTGSLVTLDGSGSSDADSDTLTYSWSFSSRPASSTATLTDATTANTSFTPDKDGFYIVQLIVNDGAASSTADKVTIKSVNSGPVANAGPDQYVLPGALVTLDGSGSTDGNGETLTYHWSFTANPGSAVLSDETAVKPTFTADVAGSYIVSLVVSDGTTDSATDTVMINAEMSRVLSLPDTSQIKCYDSSGNTVSCAGTGQDGEYNVNSMSFADNGDGTVTDNVTGLMWQQGENALTYNWYQASGTADATYNPDGAVDVCGSLSLGGYSDWRLPTKKELLYVVDYGKDNPTVVSTTYFPNMKVGNYWSSTANPNDATTTWGVAMGSGSASDLYMPNGYYVRCVRGQSSSDAFTDNGNGTVTDNQTGLIWQREDDDTTRTWQEALSYCDGLELASYRDWRLPNIKELASLIDDARSGPAVDSTYFPNTNESNYWSSTTLAYPNYRTNAWYVRFSDGYVYHDYDYHGKENGYHVRCVR